MINREIGYRELDEVKVSGERADLVSLSNGKEYAVIDPSKVYRVGSPIGESFRVPLWKISDKKTIGLVLNSLAKIVENISLDKDEMPLSSGCNAE
jgi:hypothetical protein